MIFYSLIYRELQNGVTLIDDDGKELGQSVRAAKEGIAAVTFSRILMAMPGMGKTFPPKTHKTPH